MRHISRDSGVASILEALEVPAARRYVGRMGVLSGALGIGAVLATGLGAAVANADADGSDAASLRRGTATSQESGTQSASTVGASRRGAALSAGRSAPAATVGDAASHRSSAKVPAAASALAPTRSPSLLIPTRDVHVDLPAAPAPEWATPVVSVAATAVSLAPSQANSANSVALYQLPPPRTTAAGGPVATAVRNVVEALSNVANRTVPALPADGPVALMMAAVRRAESTTPTPIQTTTTGGLEAESMTISPSNGGRVVSDSSASGGQAIQLTSNAIASGAVTLPDSTALVIRAKAPEFGSSQPEAVG